MEKGARRKNPGAGRAHGKQTRKAITAGESLFPSVPLIRYNVSNCFGSGHYPFVSVIRAARSFANARGALLRTPRVAVVHASPRNIPRLPPSAPRRRRPPPAPSAIERGPLAAGASLANRLNYYCILSKAKKKPQKKRTRKKNITYAFKDNVQVSSVIHFYAYSLNCSHEV